jgi:hypothetical protein
MKQLRTVVAVITLMIGSWNAMGQQPPATERPLASAMKPLVKVATCAEVAAWLNGVLGTRATNNSTRNSTNRGDDTSLAKVPREISLGKLPLENLDCAGVPSRVPVAHFQLKKVFYDRTLHSWEFLAHCVNGGDCTPFLIRWPRPGGEPAPNKSVAEVPVAFARASASPIFSPPPLAHFLLRAGDTATLVWDQDGIRAVLPAVCLEKGNVGDAIRVRIKNGTRVLRAEIVNESLLRAIV